MQFGVEGSVKSVKDIGRESCDSEREETNC